MYANAFKSGVLKEEVHGRLVQNLDAYARDAGIQPRWVWTPLAATCGQVEVNYVRQYPTHRAEGLVSGLLYLRDASAEFPTSTSACPRSPVRSLAISSALGL